MNAKSPPSKIQKLHELSRDIPEGQELDRAWKEIHEGSDTASVLLASAWIDRNLEESIRQRFCSVLKKDERDEIFGLGGLLLDFRAKVDIGYALGIFGPVTKNALAIIGKIRNAFAHSPRVLGFSTPRVAIECQKLAVLIPAYKQVAELELSDMPSEGNDARSQYLDCCLTIVMALLVDQNKRAEATASRARLTGLARYASTDVSTNDEYRLIP